MAESCTVKRIKQTRLCIGDLRHLVTIQTRSLDASDYTLSQPVETFTTVRQQWCAIETAVAFTGAGVARFAKVNILDDATHIFYCEWDASFPDLENRNHYILHDSRRFKVLKVDNMNERNGTIAIQTTDRGESTETAAQA